MISITAASMNQIINQQKQIQISNEVTQMSFIKDLEKSYQFTRLLDNNLLFLKHKTLPEAIKQNKSEITFNFAISSFLGPWIINDATLKSLAIKTIGNAIMKCLPAYYVVEQIGVTEDFKISWKL